MDHGCVLFCMLGTLPKLSFSKQSFRDTTRASNSLDPDKDQRIVGSGFGTNRLQR